MHWKLLFIKIDFDFDFEIFYWSGVRIHIYMLDYDGIFQSL